MEKLGTHILLDLYGCDFDQINDAPFIIQILSEAAKISGATVEDISIKEFDPQGLTVLILISESHLSFHSYPESNTCMIDIFTCGDHTFPQKGMRHILKNLSHDSHNSVEISRGRFDPLVK